MSDLVMQMFIMCRMTSQVAGNPVLSIRMHTPSTLRAAELRMPKIERPSSSSEIVPSLRHRHGGGEY